MFLSHSIEKRRIRHQRLVTALRARKNSFKELASAFPKGFLTNDLTAYLNKALIDICEQLVRLEPKDPQHAEQLAFYNSQLNNLSTSEHQARVKIENPQQIKEARLLLQELLKFVGQQVQAKQLSAIHGQVYADQIKRLVLQMTVDNHSFSAKQAQQAGKPRLAIHHFNLAKKLLLAENASHLFDKQITQLDAIIQRLEASLGATTNAETESNPAGTPPITDTNTNKEWDEFNKENEDWKKKQIYD